MKKDLEVLVEEINASYGKELGGPIVQVASEITNPYILKRPSGIASLDVEIGGGFPAGTLCQIAAPDGVGKNALCNQFIATTQQTYGEDSSIAWVCTEITLDKLFAQMFGVVVPMSSNEIEMINAAQALKGRPPLSKEEVKFRKKKLGEFLIVDKGSSAQRLNVALKLIESNQFQIVVIDSMTALLTEVQEETDLEDEPQQSSEARLVTRFCQKYWGRARLAHNSKDNANWTTVIATYQVRGNRSSAKFKKAWSVGGAFALRHAKCIDVHMESGDRYPPARDKPQLGKRVKFNIKKGKAGCHEGGKGEFLYLFDEGFDVWSDVIEQAKKRNILQRAGKYWKWIKEDGSEREKFEGGVDGIVSKMVEDENIYWEMYRDVIKDAGMECVYKL